eukprot:TRINITY_DN38010_c0_g1_i18.p1 TRINITY_DN38010_c0_g1~~TRINITY_DN38010_c0_g1_i18.p1  ORF type:complete len:273 (+),score=57.69 TRINITY_DN38010_c0_g1_i18:147-965(+)
MREEEKDVNSMWTHFKTSLMSAVESNIPSSLRRSSYNLPWIDRKIRKLLRRKKRLYNQAKKTKNWCNYNFTQECRRLMIQAEARFITTTIEDGLKENNTKPFWRYVKSRRQDNAGVAPLRKGTSLFSDSASKAKILLQQFQSVFTHHDGSPPPNMHGKPYPGIDSLTINPEGVAKLLRNLNPAKASGPDNIPNRVLKVCADAIAPSLTAIYITSIESGKLPDDWLTANISSAFKKGDRHKAENYRPISLTSVACKLLEHNICRHLHCHLEKT